MRTASIPFLLALLVLLAGCGYAREISVHESPGVLRPSPDPARYGSVRVVWVREYRKPVGLLRFPDGGRARDVALYAIVYQYPAGSETDEADAGERREVARIQLKPVRRWDFGNLGWGTYEWVAPDRFRYRQEYGYPPGWKVAEGELQIPPLP